MKISNTITRKERRAINKLWHSKIYKISIAIAVILFSPKAKKFVSLRFSRARKVFGIISLSVYNFFGIKFWYVDDFIIHKKLRGKWVWEKLFNTTLEEAKKEKCDYVFLFSRKERKISHKFYKKTGLTIISLSVGVLAYKKYNNKKYNNKK